MFTIKNLNQVKQVLLKEIKTIQKDSTDMYNRACYSTAKVIQAQLRDEIASGKLTWPVRRGITTTKKAFSRKKFSPGKVQTVKAMAFFAKFAVAHTIPNPGKKEDLTIHFRSRKGNIEKKIEGLSAQSRKTVSDMMRKQAYSKAKAIG